ncbi:hypothetical protein BGX24_003734 [Mortierella sp. AD032]|nr:hypothetical protein BGX24_003734 [Mortierella sp. AD032]
MGTLGTLGTLELTVTATVMVMGTDMGMGTDTLMDMGILIMVMVMFTITIRTTMATMSILDRSGGVSPGYGVKDNDNDGEQRLGSRPGSIKDVAIGMEETSLAPPPPPAATAIASAHVMETMNL